MDTKRGPVHQTEPALAQVNVRLATNAEHQRAVQALSRIPAVRDVVQLFPDEADPELSRLYVVEIDPLKLQPTLDRIRHNPDVEYVEEPARRRLIG